ncbi:hypothetical protein KLP42_00545 [Rhizobium sp. CSW-27]|nr:hypothetical protein [Rhizobium sp. CSW-27]
MTLAAGKAPATTDNPDAVPPGTPNSGENTCRRCLGTGEIDGADCPDCAGSGIVITPVGGAG